MGFLTAFLARFAALPGLLMSLPSILGGALSFLSTPLGQVAAVAAVAVGAFVWGDLHRARLDSAWHLAEVEKSQQRQHERDAEIKDAVARDVATRIAGLEKLSIELQGKVDGYEKTLSTSNACVLSPADVLRLRKL
jgi:hypothetical protein